MNHKNIIYLIIFNLMVMIFATGLIISRYLSITKTQPTNSSVTSSFKDSQIPSKTENFRSKFPSQNFPLEIKKIANDSNDAPEIEIQQEINNADFSSSDARRNIGFVFRNSLAMKVAIIGDFNEWIPQSMAMGENFQWTINLKIPEGDYAYNFVVDGRPIRDPNNPKACNVGRGFPNSYLKVSALQIKGSDAE